MRGESISNFDQSVDTVEFLVRSWARVRILDELNQQGSLEKDELRERIDASRTTMQRNLDALEEKGWVENSRREYFITNCGELVVRDVLNLVNSVQISMKLQPIMQWFPISDIDLDIQELADADVIVADEYNPYAPTNRHVEKLKETASFRGVLPRVGRTATETAWQRISAGTSQHELVLEEGAVDTLQSDPQYTDLFQKLNNTDRYTVFVYKDNISYFLGLLDDTVQLGLIDGDGMPRALIETEKKKVYNWAEQTYKSYKQHSDLLS